MKTKEEPNALKEEVKTLNTKLAELTADELAEVSGGTDADGKYTCNICGKQFPSYDALMAHFIVVP